MWADESKRGDLICEDCQVSWPVKDGRACWCCGVEVPADVASTRDRDLTAWKKGGVLQRDEPLPDVCVNCGNDAPTEGMTRCLDCLEGHTAA